MYDYSVCCRGHWEKIRTTRFVVFQRTLPALDCQVVRVFELPMIRRRRCVVSPVHFVSLLVTSFHLPSSLSYPFGIVLNSRFVYTLAARLAIWNSHGNQRVGLCQRTNVRSWDS